MADPTLLVPGTQATELVDEAGVVVYNAVRVSLGIDRDNLGGRLPPAWEKTLSMEHVPGVWRPVKTSLQPGTTLHPGRVVRTPYERLHNKVKIRDWPYDWRADLRWNANKLLHFLEENRPPEGRRWNLVGHSQGGLLIVLAAKLARRVDDFARLVARVVLVGAPLAGTMRALEALMPGRQDLGTKNIDRTRAMTRTWPAIYQMLPAWNGAVNGSGDPLPGDRQFDQVGGYPAPWDADVSADNLERARETQSLFEGPMSGFGTGVATIAIMGRAQDTPLTLEWTPADGFKCKKPRQDQGAPVPCKEFEFSTEKGDSLVPAQETLDWGGTRFKGRSSILEGNPRAHAMLCDDETVVKGIRQFLSMDAPSPPATA